MGIGKIASFLSALSPSSEAAATTASADQVPEDIGSRATGLSEQSGLTHDQQQGDPNDITAQLQTLVSAVRILNDNAVQQGAAMAMSSAGTQLKNAVSGLGHLLTAVNSQSLAHAAAAPVREAASVIDAVEAGQTGTQAAAEQVMRNLPTQQALRAREASDRFQTDMRTAIDQVRTALSDLKRQA